MSTLALVLAAFGLRRKDEIAKPEKTAERPDVVAQEVLPPPEPDLPAILKRDAPVRREPRTVIATHVVAHRFVRWMQSQPGCTGYWLVDEIDMLREAFCDKYNIQVPNAYEFRSYLAGVAGVTKGRYRLNSWEFLEVKKRTHMERPVLYRISDRAVSDAVSGQFYGESADVRTLPHEDRSVSHSGRSDSGRNAGRINKRSRSKRYLHPREAA